MRDPSVNTTRPLDRLTNTCNAAWALHTARDTEPTAARGARWSPALQGRSLVRLIAGVILLLAWSSALAQIGAMYWCPGNEFSNAIADSEARTRSCTKLSNAEWVFYGSDSAGRRYEYNDRRTIFKGGGRIETWLQTTPGESSSGPVSAAETVGSPKTVSPHVIQCTSRTIVSGATYVYYPQTQAIVKDSRAVSPYFPPPAPVAEALVRHLCADRRSRAASGMSEDFEQRAPEKLRALAAPGGQVLRSSR